jgi:hypothetical protein
MTAEDQVHEDIAFIRTAIEQGRGYATTRGFDLLVWGVTVAAGYLATYATVSGWWRIHPNWIWTACIALPWLYSMRRALPLLHSPSDRACSQWTQVLRMLWLGCGIFLSTFSIAVTAAGEMRQGWFSAVSAGTLGVAFFASSYLCGLAWMRWVAVGWWAAALLVYSLRQNIAVLPLSAVLMLVLLALPGLLLRRNQHAYAGK